MKICAAQTRPITGDIQRNIEKHLQLIDHAVSAGVELIIFSELSLTGYEPSLADNLATHADDHRFDIFQTVSNATSITIGVGVPTKNGQKVSISMILFQPNKPRLVYSKKYLHPDEDEFFVPGRNFSSVNINNTQVGIAICYELSIPEHSQAARESGAEVYIASVAKFAKGVEDAVKTLAEIAAKYSMPVLMSNAIGPADNGECTGNSSVWNCMGHLAGQLSNSHEGILIFDTDTGLTFEKPI